jgi:hypothetical protein
MAVNRIPVTTEGYKIIGHGLPVGMIPPDDVGGLIGENEFT